jgi:pSer/pThr/pTyr-binding forkhead associated (FHA) protein
MIPSEPSVAEMAAAARQELKIVLQPISHPDLGDIVIDDNLLAIGRAEAPFASYPPDVVAGLSRRQARIFSAHGVAYIADLGSKNGTTVNGSDVREVPRSLCHGDEICLGGELSYRVRVSVRASAPERTTRLVGLTLIPERGDVGLQPIILNRFPFLVSKQDEMFAHHTDAYPHQVNYISRRHAHIFVRGGTPFIEDLGSTNGTFVGGVRLDEHAVPLEEGDVVAFGGKHFVYKVSLTKVVETEPTVTKGFAPSPAEEPGDPEKTTFVASAASFLDIFCVDGSSQHDDELNTEDLKQPEAAKQEAVRPPQRGRVAILLSELTEAFVGKDRRSIRRACWWVASAAAAVGAFGSWLYVSGASEREVKDLFASGEYARAATVASKYLEGNPDSAEIKALGGQALLKAKVPGWLTMLRAGDFDQASAALAGMKQLSTGNAEAQSLIDELEWMGDLERFVVGRGGVDAPIRIYADEDRIKALLKQWNEDTQRHQRAFATISSYVPEFKDAYAEALSHLRKLQNDDSVYLAAIERLKVAISAELDRDAPEALEAVVKEYAEKYPRLGGLDGVRGDLRQYLEVERELRARRVGRLVGLLAKVRFATPPFEAKFRALASSDRFPPADLVREYRTVSKAWRQGDTSQAFAGLQQLGTGPWAGAIARELERKKSILEQYVALQKARGTQGYEERLLEFHGSLDSDEDTYFVRATAADIALYKDRAVARAEESLNRAEQLWRRYLETGAIDGRQRLRAAITNEFRAQAQLLSEAHESAQQGMRLYAQLKVTRPPRWRKVQEEIRAELEQQRSSLLDLRHVLEPAPLKAKLALLGGPER